MIRAKIATCALLLACSFHLSAATLPDQGATMCNVEGQFGRPINKSGPIGSPAITRWEYDHFVVVFERNRVVHSFSLVGNKSTAVPAPTAAPAPTPIRQPAPQPF